MNRVTNHMLLDSSWRKWSHEWAVHEGENRKWVIWRPWWKLSSSMFPGSRTSDKGLSVDSLRNSREPEWGSGELNGKKGKSIPGRVIKLVADTDNGCLILFDLLRTMQCVHNCSLREKEGIVSSMHFQTPSVKGDPISTNSVTFPICSCMSAKQVPENIPWCSIREALEQEVRGMQSRNVMRCCHVVSSEIWSNPHQNFTITVVGEGGECT